MARSISKKNDIGGSGAVRNTRQATPLPKNTKKATPNVAKIPSLTASNRAAQRGAGGGVAVGPTSVAGKSAQAPKMNARRISQPLYKDYVNSKGNSIAAPNASMPIGNAKGTSGSISNVKGKSGSKTKGRGK